MVIHLPHLPDPGKGLGVLIRAAPVMKRFIKVMGSVFPEHPGKAICFQINYSSPEGLLIPVAKSRHHAVRIHSSPQAMHVHVSLFHAAPSASSGTHSSSSGALL